MGAPQTLPADFQGWDKAPPSGAPATLPANFNQWDNNHTPQGASPGFWDRVKDALKPRKYSEESGFAAKQKGQPEGLPGVSEGAGLAGGLAEWDKASGGEIAGGVGDILRGDVAKGLHRMFTGTGHALTPALPLLAPGMAAAPLTTVAALGGGAAGGAIAKTGAEALGATPEQAQVAGDVGNLLGAGVPTATKFAVSRARALFSALPGDLQQEVLGVASPRMRSIIRLWKGLEELGARGRPLDATGENVPFAGKTTPPPTAAAPAPAPTIQTAGKLSEMAAAPTPAPAPVPAVARTPAVRDPSTILPRLRQIAQQIEAQEANAPSKEEDLLPDLLKSLEQVRASRSVVSTPAKTIMSAIEKEGGNVVGVGQLANAAGISVPEARSIIAELQKTGRIDIHIGRQAGEAQESIYGAQLKLKPQ